MTLNRAQKEELYTLLMEKAIRQARTDFGRFISLVKEDYNAEWFHKVVIEKLNAFARGEIKNLMILMPPQHGKSELASRLFPAFQLGVNPNKRIGLITYNDTFAKKFNKQIQRNIDNVNYKEIFPLTALSGSKHVETLHDNYSRNANEFEVVNHYGSMITVGRGGQINGLPIDLLIMDDLYKNREEAISPTVSEKIWGDYNEVFKTRLHNGSQQLMMNTRWDELDVAGRLLKTEPDKWEIIRFAAIKENEFVPYDPRNEGEALYPSRHSLEKLLEAKKANKLTFNALYQQDPKPNSELLCIPTWYEIDSMPYDNIERIMWGIDWGWNNPTALIKVGVNLKNRELYLDECFYKPLSDEEIGRKALLTAFKNNNYIKGQAVVADRAPSEIAFLTANNIYTAPAHKPEGCVQARISLAKTFKIYVTARSYNLKKALNNYQWVTFGEVITNEPLKNGVEHSIDASFYPLFQYYYNK